MKISDISYYLFESYKDAVEKFSQEEDREIVNQYLDSFKQLAKKGIVTGQEKDIGYWIKQGWNVFKELVDKKSQEKTQSQVKQFKKKDVIIAHEDEEKIAVIPLTKDASCLYGKGTKWCTSATEGLNYFIEYFYLNRTVMIYIFMKNKGEKYALAYSREARQFEYFDELDQSISKEEFENKTNTDFLTIKKWLKEHQQTITKAMKINDSSEDTKKEFVRIRSDNINDIKNPSEEVQLSSVEQNGESIKYIDNPSEKVKLAAVKSNVNSIDFIENPDYEMKLYHGANVGQVLRHIKDLDNSMISRAIDINGGGVIKNVDDPDESIQLKAIEDNPYSITFIENPTEKVKQLQKELWGEK